MRPNDVGGHSQRSHCAPGTLTVSEATSCSVGSTLCFLMRKAGEAGSVPGSSRHDPADLWSAVSSS